MKSKIPGFSPSISVASGDERTPMPSRYCNQPITLQATCRVSVKVIVAAADRFFSRHDVPWEAQLQ